jgi:hypothetical protein
MSTSKRRLKVEKDLITALERLKRGEPKNATLAKRAQSGRLSINPSTVAKEAGRSRTLIGSEGCAYGSVRELILQARNPSRARASRSGKDVIATLRQTVSELQAQLITARTLLAAQRITIDALSRGGSND